MNEAKAILKNYRQSPRKVRLVTDLVRGKKIDEAITTLSFIPKRAALPIEKLLSSALANAKNLSMPIDDLIVKEIKVDAGSTLYRSQPRSYRGGVSTIRKRTSHVSVVLAESKAKSNKLKATT